MASSAVDRPKRPKSGGTPCHPGKAGCLLLGLGSRQVRDRPEVDQGPAGATCTYTEHTTNQREITSHLPNTLVLLPSPPSRPFSNPTYPPTYLLTLLLHQTPPSRLRSSATLTSRHHQSKPTRVGRQRGWRYGDQTQSEASARQAPLLTSGGRRGRKRDRRLWSVDQLKGLLARAGRTAPSLAPTRRTARPMAAHLPWGVRTRWTERTGTAQVVVATRH